MALNHDFEKFPELTNAQLEVFQFDSPHKQYTEDFSARVERVHDGDTITLSTLERDFLFPLRLLDIDAPEIEDGGDTARDWLSGRLLGKEVQVLIDPNNRVGKYGRLLGHVQSVGLNVAEEMLHLGLVVPFGTKNEGEPEPIGKITRASQWFQ